MLKREDPFIDMFQEITPHIYHNEYRPTAPQPDDVMIVQKDRKLLMKGLPESSGGKVKNSGGILQPGDYALPTVSMIEKLCAEAVNGAYYLFSVDQKHFFSTDKDVAETADMKYLSVMTLREQTPDYMSFGGAVGWQLASWYHTHKYCGKCGKATMHSEKERAVICPSCGQVYYPRISPVVIIAIVDGDRILLTRYSRGGYRRHALVAGFVEIGETLEDAVRREIMEEVGLRVKNIRYCESQPWPFSSSLIAGFFADVDGDPSVELNTDGLDELAEAVWVNREDIVMEDTNLSLTWDMIGRFKANRGVPAVSFPFEDK